MSDSGTAKYIAKTRYKVNPVVDRIVTTWCRVCEGDAEFRLGLTATYVTIISILSALAVFLLNSSYFFLAVPLLVWGFVPEAMTRSLIRNNRAICLPEYQGDGYRWQTELYWLLNEYTRYCDSSLAEDSVSKNKEVFVEHEPEIWNMALGAASVITRRRGKKLEGDAQQALNDEFRKLNAARNGVADLVGAADTITLMSAALDIGHVDIERGVTNLHAHLGTLRELESGEYNV